MALGKLLIEKLNPGSIIDVGCSSGIYLVPYLERGIEVLGIDGARDVGQHIPGNFRVVDLRQSWTPPHRYDLAYCVEVAEHLHCEFSDTLVKTVCDCSDTIFFTAARPGQGGEGHWCEQTKNYWLNLFSKYGIGLHPRNEVIMAVINPDLAYDHCGWIRTNGMLLGKIG